MVDTLWDRIIATETEHQKMQLDYFIKREKKGELHWPQVYQPKCEPEEGSLAVVFVEPGAVHLVFRDEIAPIGVLDTRYRELRQKVFGRVHDVESVEIIDSQIKFSNNAAFLNIYESSLHWTWVEPYKDAIFSETWNHMLSAGGKWINIIRGGYRLMGAPIIEGDREAAENWAPQE